MRHAALLVVTPAARSVSGKRALTDGPAVVTLVLMMFGLGCRVPVGSGASPGTPRALPVDAAVPSAEEPLYLLPNPPPLRDLCTKTASAPAPATCTGSTTYSLANVVLAPVPGGPLIARQPRPGVLRGLADFIHALEERGADLRSCQAWAGAQQPMLAGQLTMRIVVDPWGAAESVAVTADAADAAPLAKCVEESLADLRVESVTCRRTSATLRLRFAAAPLLPALQTLPRPRFVRSDSPLPSRVCLHCPVELPTDELAAADAVLQIPGLSCAEDVADEQSYQAALTAWKGRGPRPTRRPIVTMISLAKVRPSLSSEYVGSTVRANLGAYRKCYREALQRTPGLTGTLNFALTLGELGEATAVRLRDAKVSDAALVQCLSAALAELFVEPALGRCRSHVEVPFELQPELPPPSALVAENQTARPLQIAAAAEDWLHREAGTPALRHYSALIRHASNHPRACHFYLGALRAVMLDEPWAGDATMAAVAGLARHTQQHPDTAADCLAEAAPLLASLARVPAVRANFTQLLGLRERAVSRYRLLVEWTPPLPNSAVLRFELADSLVLLHRYAEAAAEYRRITAADATSALAVQQKLTQLEQLSQNPLPFAAATTRPSCYSATHRRAVGRDPH